MFTSIFTNLLFVFIIFTFINLVIKCYNIFKDKMDNFIISYSTYDVKNYDKITHSLHFTNLNRFYYWNSNIKNNIFDITQNYLKKYYKNNINLYILVFQFNKINNTFSLISNINEIDFNPYSDDNFKNLIINKSLISGNKDILIVVKEM
jgi:hypothetical protein